MLLFQVWEAARILSIMNLKEFKFLFYHSSIYGLGTVIAQAVAFVLLPVYTRYLTPRDYGVLELIDVTNMLIGIVLTIGIARGMSRFYYEEEGKSYRDRVVCTSYIVYLIVCLLILPILIRSSPFFSKLVFSDVGYSKYFIISFFSLFLGGIIDVGLMYLRLLKRPVHFVFISVSRLIVLICLNVLFIVVLEMGVLGILLSSLITRSLFSVLITCYILWKVRFGFSIRLFKEILKFCIPLIPANFTDTMIKQSDKYFILYFLTIADAGIYGLALKLGNAIHLLLTMPFIMAYVPRRFELLKKKEANQIFKQTYTYYSFLFIFLGLSLSVLVPEILKLMTTEKFYRAGQYIPLVIFSMYLLGSQYHFDFGILYSKKTKQFAYINAGVAILHLCLNYFIIKRYGMWGAVWCSVLVLGAQAFLYYHVSNRYYKIEFEFFRISKYLLCGVVFYLVSRWINTDDILINIFFKLILLALFPVILTLLRIISHEEIDVIRRAIKKNFPKLNIINVK